MDSVTSEMDYDYFIHSHKIHKHKPVSDNYRSPIDYDFEMFAHTIKKAISMPMDDIPLSSNYSNIDAITNNELVTSNVTNYDKPHSNASHVIEETPFTSIKPLTLSPNYTNIDAAAGSSSKLLNEHTEVESHTDVHTCINRNKHIPYIYCDTDLCSKGIRKRKTKDISLSRMSIAAHMYHRDSPDSPKFMPTDEFLMCLDDLKIVFNKNAIQTMDIEMSIPSEVQYILSLGPKFSLPIPFNQKKAHLLIEAIRRINNIYLSPYEKTTIAGMAREYMENISNTYDKIDDDQLLFMAHCYNCTIKFFDTNKFLVVLMADKGNISVITNKHTYVEKMESHLADKTIYQAINPLGHETYNITNGYKMRNQVLLKKLADCNIIRSNVIPSIMANEDSISNLYGMIKLHKIDRPIRPVVNTKSSPGYMLAQIVTRILSTARETHKYNIKNSLDAAQRISYITPEPDEYLASFDIKNMFTNINICSAINSIYKRYHNGLIPNSIPFDLLKEIVLFVAAFSTLIKFNDKVFKQIRGLKMGSSLSQILADFVIEDILDDTFKYIERPKLFLKYVDDCALIARKPTIEIIYKRLNEADVHLEFVITEEDENGVVIYLDIEIKNTHRFKILMKWYQKPFASGRIINFLSSHPKSTIMNTAKCFVYNMYCVTSNSLISGLDKIADKILFLNNFPLKTRKIIIRFATHKWLNDRFNQDIFQNTMYTIDSGTCCLFQNNERINDIFIPIPFINGVTPHIQHNITQMNRSIKSIGVPINTLKVMFDKHKNLRD